MSRSAFYRSNGRQSKISKPIKLPSVLLSEFSMIRNSLSSELKFSHFLFANQLPRFFFRVFVTNDISDVRMYIYQRAMPGGRW